MVNDLKVAERDIYIPIEYLYINLSNFGFGQKLFFRFGTYLVIIFISSMIFFNFQCK